MLSTFWVTSNTLLLNSFIINTILILLYVLIGGILPLYERKFLSLTQRRVGPKYVGYKGRLQFLADALKVLWKEHILLYRFHFLSSLITPILYLNLNLFIFINLVWLNNTSFCNIEYNLVFVLVLDVFLHILIAFTGLLLQNKYTIIATNRLLNVMFVTEFFTALVITLFILIIKTFSFQKLFCLSVSYKLIWLLLGTLPLLLMYFLIETAKTPFDVVEAETEIIMGYHVEYSGFLFGLYVLSEYFHVILNLYLLLLFLL